MSQLEIEEVDLSKGHNFHKNYRKLVVSGCKAVWIVLG